MRLMNRPLAATALAWLAAVPAESAPAPLTPESMWQLKRVGAPALSWDGKLASYAMTRYDADNDKGEADLYLVATAGGEPQRLTSTKGNESELAFSPDGRWIAFVAKRGDDQQSQLYVIGTNGGEAVRVSDVPTGVSAPRWFPDSRRIAFITEVWPEITDWAKAKEKLAAREASKMSAMTWDRPPVAHWDHFVEDRVPHLYSIPLEGGTPTPITLASGHFLPRRENGTDSYDISPDGQEIAFVVNTNLAGNDENLDVFTVAASGGPARNLTAANPATDEEIRAASLQFVRKLSGFTAPSKANEAAFNRAVADVSRVARRLVDGLVTGAAPRDRAVEAARARARAAQRFGRPRSVAGR